MVRMDSFGKRYPQQMSGGQQQRIALARALVFDPQLVLMDEPLGALDKQLREHMQIEIKHIHASLGVTFVFVTHDQSEALTMSDRIAVFDQGIIQQVDRADKLYEEPANAFVASFIGENNAARRRSRARRWQPLCGAAGSRRRRNRKRWQRGRGGAARLAVGSARTRVPEWRRPELREQAHAARCRSSSISATTYACAWRSPATPTSSPRCRSPTSIRSIKAGQAIDIGIPASHLRAMEPLASA